MPLSHRRGADSQLRDGLFDVLDYELVDTIQPGGTTRPAPTGSAARRPRGCNPTPPDRRRPMPPPPSPHRSSHGRGPRSAALRAPRRRTRGAQHRRVENVAGRPYDENVPEALVEDDLCGRPAVCTTRTPPRSAAVPSPAGPAVHALAADVPACRRRTARYPPSVLSMRSPHWSWAWPTLCRSADSDDRFGRASALVRPRTAGPAVAPPRRHGVASAGQRVHAAADAGRAG